MFSFRSYWRLLFPGFSLTDTGPVGQLAKDREATVFDAVCEPCLELPVDGRLACGPFYQPPTCHEILPLSELWFPFQIVEHVM